MQHKEVTDRQLEALLESIDRLTTEVARINRRLEASEGLVLVARELSQLNESMQTLAYAATDELHQHFIRGRHASPVDVAIDAVGVALGMLVWLRVRQR